MKTGEVGIAFTAKEFYFTQNLRVVTVQSEAAIGILHIAAGNEHSVGYLQEIVVVAAYRADYPWAAFG